MLPQALIVAATGSLGALLGLTLALGLAAALPLELLDGDVFVPLLHAVPASSTAAAHTAVSARVVRIDPAIINQPPAALLKTVTIVEGTVAPDGSQWKPERRRFAGEAAAAP